MKQLLKAITLETPAAVSYSKSTREDMHINKFMNRALILYSAIAILGPRIRLPRNEWRYIFSYLLLFPGPRRNIRSVESGKLSGLGYAVASSGTL